MGRAAAKGFAGFTNTKGVPSSRNAPPPHGARPSLGHIIKDEVKRGFGSTIGGYADTRIHALGRAEFVFVWADRLGPSQYYGGLSLV